MTNNFIHIEKQALIELILKSYQRGFSDTIALLIAVDVKNMFKKKDVEELVNKL